MDIPAADYELKITAHGSEDAVATFAAPLSGAGGGAGIVYAAGFLGATRPDSAFTLVLVEPNGESTQLPPVVMVELNLDMRDFAVSEDGVHVAGSFQGWSPGTTRLYDLDGDSIYTVEVKMLGGDTVYYKYLNGNSWGTDEGVSDPACGGAGGYGSDRWFAVPHENISLPPVCFNECISCVDSYVTFHVDMSEETVAEEGVFVGGGWFGEELHRMTLVEGSDSLYMLTTGLPEGPLHYKFNNGGLPIGFEDGSNLGGFIGDGG